MNYSCSVLIILFVTGLFVFTNGLSYASNLASPCGVTLGIYLARYRNAEQMKRMSAEDKRNTLIVELNKATQISIRDLQGKNNCGLLDLFKQIDYARTSVQKAVHSRLHTRGFRQTRPNDRQFKQCTNAISQWTYGMLMSGMRSGTLIIGKNEAKGVRIDNQSSMIKHDGADYYNIQVQIGGETFATALIPAAVDLGQRKIRNALVQSLKNGHRAIFVPGEKERYNWWVEFLSAAGVVTLLL